jgi:CheY-like chemotaxis protein
MARLILVVDDSDEIRSSLGEMLKDEGYATELVEDGRAALESLQSGLKPDLILLDYMMPRMDGAEFRAQQLKDTGFKNIPVVLMTAARLFDAKAMQLKWVLRKPFTVDALLSMIGLAIAQQ